jgi:hypothetical protein
MGKYALVRLAIRFQRSQFKVKPAKLLRWLFHWFVLKREFKLPIWGRKLMSSLQVSQLRATGIRYSRIVGSSEPAKQTAANCASSILSRTPHQWPQEQKYPGHLAAVPRAVQTSQFLAGPRRGSLIAIQPIASDFSCQALSKPSCAKTHGRKLSNIGQLNTRPSGDGVAATGCRDSDQEARCPV